MSLFVTKIPTDLIAITAKLPPGKFIHGVKFDQSSGELEITWEHDKLRTKHTFPTPFPVSNLEGELPEGVTLIVPPKPVQPPVTDKAPENNVKESVDTKPRSVRKPKA